jgi:hypothetical protein
MVDEILSTSPGAVAIIHGMRRWDVGAGTVLVAIAMSVPAAAQAGADREDVERALAAARTAAKAGDVIAQYSLGSNIYYGGTNMAEAVEWFRQAAARGYAPAEFQLGLMHDFGFGVTADGAQALEWYRKAAEHGSAPGQRMVGDFYRRGRVVPVDLAEAARWYQQAAEGDDIRAQSQLGQMYFDGTGVARDYPSAYLWFALAATQAPLLDNRKAFIEMRNVAAVRMTAEQIDQAKARVAVWKPTSAPQPPAVRGR